MVPMSMKMGARIHGGDVCLQYVVARSKRLNRKTFAGAVIGR